MSASESIATPHLPTSPRDLRRIGVVAHQRRHVERDREPVLTLLEQEVIAFVGLLGVAEAGELAHRPQPVAIPVGMNAARIRILAGPRQIARQIEVRHVFADRRPLERNVGDRPVDRSRTGALSGFALFRCRSQRASALRTPASAARPDRWGARSSWPNDPLPLRTCPQRPSPRRSALQLLSPQPLPPSEPFDGGPRSQGKCVAARTSSGYAKRREHASAAAYGSMPSMRSACKTPSRRRSSRPSASWRTWCRNASRRRWSISPRLVQIGDVPLDGSPQAPRCPLR